MEAGAVGLAVATYPEARELRRAGIQAPLLLLSAGDARLAPGVVKADIIQTACQEEVARALSRAAQRMGKTARVHLKLDTGLGRLGVKPERAAEFAQLLRSLPGMRLEGVFSHLATAEAADASYAQAQLDRFRSALRDLDAAGIDPGVRHLANSAASLRFPQMRFDAVRTGLLIYGLCPDAPGLAPLDLRPALTWKTRLAFLQPQPAGSPISYGGTHVTRGECLTAVLPLGYADGYPRRASNRSHVLLNGEACPVIGTICMDHVIIDASAAPNARVGDEVVLLGQQGKREITANHLAQWAETCVHEVTTVIGPRVERVYLDRYRP
jgi:alanine racemase